MSENYGTSTWECTVSFFTLLPLFIHLFMHPFPPSVFSVAWLQLWTAKTFFILCWQTQLIIYMVQSVLKPTNNPPLPPSTLTNPVIYSLITINMSFDEYFLRNCFPQTPIYRAHMCICVVLMLDINCTDFGSASSPKPNYHFYRVNRKLWSQNQGIWKHLLFL